MYVGERHHGETTKMSGMVIHSYRREIGSALWLFMRVTSRGKTLNIKAIALSGERKGTHHHFA